MNKFMIIAVVIIFFALFGSCGRGQLNVEHKIAVVVKDESWFEYGMVQVGKKRYRAYCDGYFKGDTVWVIIYQYENGSRVVIQGLK